MNRGDWLKLVLAVIGVELVGSIGTIFTVPAIPTWYAGLARPDIAPPNWIFAPVWITLFALMGVAAFLVWQQGFQRKPVKIALSIFLAQLILNVLWSVIFFGWHNPGSAFIEIIVLWLMIVVTIRQFAKVSTLAAWLLVPYIGWVSFAGYLNYLIWSLN